MNLMNNFNSIKVRLKPDTVNGDVGEHLFQFHKGTIKTWSEFVDNCRKTISIP